MIELNELRTLVLNGNTTELIKLVEDEPQLVSHVFDAGTHEVTLLSMAVSNGNEPLVRFLLEQGAGAVVTNDLISQWLRPYLQDSPPNRAILKLLVKHGAKFEFENERRCWIFTHNIMEDVYKRDWLVTLNAMLDHGFDPIGAEKLCQRSLLARAIESYAYSERPTKVIDALLSLGCSVDALSADYSSPLGNALTSERYGLVEALLDKGAEPKKLEQLPHLLAQRLNIPETLLNRLLKNQDINCTNKYGKAPIHEAIEYNNSAYVTYLVKNGVGINFNSTCSVPLIYAIEKDKKNLVKQLIKLGANVNSLNQMQETALDIAMTKAGFKSVCDIMIKAGAKTSIQLSGCENEASGIISSIEKSIPAGEVWADVCRADLKSVGIEEARSWDSLIRYCLDNNSAKPSEQWLRQSDLLVDEIGNQRVRDCLLRWLALVKETKKTILENNVRLLKGLIWISSRYGDSDMSRTLRDLASHMYKKVYGIGMRNAKLGNAALYSLSVMKGSAGLKEILVLRAATKYNPALVNINRIFDGLAKLSDLSADELAELSVPDYGLTDVGEYRVQLGDCVAIANLVSVGKCHLAWEYNGKLQKSVPATIKAEHANSIKSIKAAIKDIEVGCSAHSFRFEQMFLSGKSLDYETWNEQYINHRLIGFLARRLIWRAAFGGDCIDVIHGKNGLITAEGKIIEIPADASIRLWHPSMSSAQEVLMWREFLINNAITQPFKQAHREIYLLTDAEKSTKTYSMRFANHILKHSQFHALATHRGWKQNRGGSWDGGSENHAYKNLTGFNMEVCFEAEGTQSYGISDSGIYECVATGKLSFSKEKTVDLESVDPLVFSEILRDVDLFVGVASIGNDPNWRDRDNRYWSSSSFGDLSESAKIRRDVLANLIPKLKISAQLKLVGKFLVVEGKLSTYKIHLGSSNILMAPDDSYLCIVEAKSNSDVTLPFEGDHTLSLILSKAMLLSNDSKISDRSILSQIHRAVG